MQHLLHSSIPPDFLQYLLTFGYRLNKVSRFLGEFDTQGIQVSINHLKVTVLHYTGATKVSKDTTALSVTRVHEFTDIDRLDFIGWAMLMDLTGAVPLKEFINAVSRKELASLVSLVAHRIGCPGPGLAPDIAPTMARQLEENY
jgi:hypothetical protein